MTTFHQVCVLAFLLIFDQGFSLPVQDVSDPNMPYQLIVTPSHVNRYTADSMTLRCQHNPNVRTKLHEIFRARIVKKSTSGWDLVVEQRDGGGRPTVVGNVTALANIQGDVSNAFLQVSWGSIGPECFGVFKCYATGLDATDEVFTEKSSTLEVYEFKNFIHHLISVSADTQEKVQDMKNFTDTELARLDLGLQRLATSIETNQTVLENSLDRLENRFNSLYSDFYKQKNLANDRFTRIDNYLSNFKDFSKWPTGFYALLKPKTGCPLDQSFSVDRSYQKLHTESQSSTDPADSHSSAFSNDTLSTVDSQNFVTLEFCEIVEELTSNKESWPQGSFCVNRITTHSCPTGFTYGFVNFDTENSNARYSAANKVGGNNYLYFCCQNTSSASVPIQLPTQTPFFLYRYGGVCQTVLGMSVSEEFVQINTEDHSNNDRFYLIRPDIDHPGSSVIKFNLCYYTKL